MNIEVIHSLVQQRLKPKRWRHTEGCLAMAEQLAMRYGVSLGQARLAAVLHDSWRDRDKEELFSAATHYGVEIGPLEYHHPILLHGPMAAAWAKDELHIDDAAVLEAVRYHTTGAPGIGPLATLIYVVDTLEPSRTYPEAEQLRAMVNHMDLEQMALLVIAQSLRYQLSKEEPIDPQTVLWRNELMAKVVTRLND